MKRPYCIKKVPHNLPGFAELFPKIAVWEVHRKGSGVLIDSRMAMTKAYAQWIAEALNKHQNITRNTPNHYRSVAMANGWDRKRSKP